MFPLLMLALFSCSSDSEVVPKKTPAAKKDAFAEAKAVRAIVGPMNVEIPKGTHRVLPASVASDYNLYPANNGVVLQGVVSGPIGNHKVSASFWVNAVHDPAVENGPSHLEAALVYPVECDDCPGEKQIAVKIDSRKSTEDKPASLLRVKSMKVQDLDEDGTFEVVLETRYRACCEGEAGREHCR